MSQGLSIENTIEDVANPGNMYHKCFSEYDKYSKLHA